MTRKCSECGHIKDIDEFYFNKNGAGGRLNICKTCHKKKHREYRHSRKGVVAQMLSHQRHSSKARQHEPPLYSLDELRGWVHSQDNWESLYVSWVTSGFLKDLKPSTDRLNDYRGYMLDNMRLVTWRENIDKMSADRISGANNKISKAVVGTNIDTGEIIEFYSARSAARSIGVAQGGISGCCLNKPKYKTAGGYTWKFKDVSDDN